MQWKGGRHTWPHNSLYMLSVLVMDPNKKGDSMAEVFAVNKEKSRELHLLELLGPMRQIAKKIFVLTSWSERLGAACLRCSQWQPSY